MFIVQHVLTHLPIIDFRAYAVGKNLEEGMQFPEDGSIPPVHDFMLEDEQSDLANDILKMDKAILVIASSIEKSEFDGFPEGDHSPGKSISNGCRKRVLVGVPSSNGCHDKSDERRAWSLHSESGRLSGVK